MTKSGIKSSGSSKGGKSRSPARSATTSAGSSRRDGREKTSDENTTISAIDDRRRGRTDWSAVDALSDAEISRAVRSDPDAVPLDFDWSEAVLVSPPRKQAISIRVDEDVLAYFKSGGAGYQRRMNAILRHFVQEQLRKKRA